MYVVSIDGLSFWQTVSVSILYGPPSYTSIIYFLQNSDAVLAAFSSSKLDDNKSSKKKLQQRRNLEPDTFFAKYLTSEKVGAYFPHNIWIRDGIRFVLDQMEFFACTKTAAKSNFIPNSYCTYM